MNPDSPGSRDLSEAERAVLRRLTRANLVAGLGIGCFAAVSPFAFYAALGILRGALPEDWAASSCGGPGGWSAPHCFADTGIWRT